MFHDVTPFRATRIARFGRGGAILRSRDVPLSLEQIAQAAPSVLAADKHISRSARYTYIPTLDVLAGLQREGFEPFEVRQGGSSDAEKRAFTKHMIRLRQRGAVTVGDSHREVILINAHDGTSSYQLMSGLFRLVCSNGLVVADGEAQGVRVPHKGDIVGQVIEGAYRVIDEGRDLDRTIADLRTVELSAEEGEAFAETAASLRWQEGAPVEPRQLLAPRRSDDHGADLWRTMNRVQENLIRGGVSYVQRDENGRRVARRQTRPVQGIDGNVTINRALWMLTRRMQEIKAA